MEVGPSGEIGILARDGDNKILFNDMMNNNQVIFIDSEQTIYDDLKENNSCSLNTSNYSVSKTANHFTKRLDHAYRKLAHIETSITKQTKLRMDSSSHLKRKNSNTGRMECEVCGRRDGLAQDDYERDLAEGMKKMSG